MHESGLVQSLIRRTASLAEERGRPVRAVGIRVGAFSGVDPETLRTHWRLLADPALSDVRLDLEVEEEPTGEASLGVVLGYVELEDPPGLETPGGS